MDFDEIKRFLDKKTNDYLNTAFLEGDPLSIPHRYTKKQDIELAAFFAALFAWGRRATILKKTRLLLRLMDDAPYEFVTQHEEKDLKRFMGFVHRTFNAVDLFHFIHFFKGYYNENSSLETAFTKNLSPGALSVEEGINGFYRLIFDKDTPARTRRHFSAPFKKSACKRTNMFLRWMVRKADEGVDFGLWKNIRTDQLVIPLDIHVQRVSSRLGLIAPGDPVTWKTAFTLTQELKKMNPEDPVKYDFALYSLGIMEKFV